MKYSTFLLLLFFLAANACTSEVSLDSNLASSEETLAFNDTLELTMNAQLSSCIGYGCFFDCDQIVVERGQLDQKKLSLFVYAGPNLQELDQDVSPNRCSFVFAKNVDAPEAQGNRKQGFLDEANSSYWEIVEIRRAD